MNAFTALSNRFVAVALTALTALPFVPSSLTAHASAPSSGDSAAAVSTDLDSARARHGAVSMAYEENRGQADPAALYVGRGQKLSIALTRTAAVYSVSNGEARASVSISFGATAGTNVISEGEPVGVSNYLRGSRDAWRTNVPSFSRIRYENVAPGIDTVFHGTRNAPEYDFIVEPGADPKAIAMTFEGAESKTIDADGNLRLATAAGEIVLNAPVLYQVGAGQRQPVEGAFEVDGGAVRFTVGAYDPSLELVIDPVVDFCTFVGGNGDDRIEDAKIDSNGSLFIVGSTLSTNFPVIGGLGGNESGMDAFITKIGAGGLDFTFSTYLGGASTDFANAVALANGKIYIAGGTASNSFPFVNSYDDNPNGLDAFLTVLNSTGSTVLYSTVIGGGNNDIGNAVAVDVNGNAYLAGETLETGLFGQFPTKSPSSLDPFQKNFADGRSDAFVCKFDPDESGNTSLVYSTLLGGSEGEGVEDIVVDANERAYVCGYTESADFPRQSAMQNTYGGGTNDAFVTKFNADGTTVFYSTFLGGSAIDEALGIALDPLNPTRPTIVGHTTSTNFPTTSPVQTAKNGPEDMFITKLNDAGTSRLFSTYWGGPGNDSAKDVAFDRLGIAYAVGFSNNSFPQVNGLGLGNGTGICYVAISQANTVVQSTSTSVNGTGEGIGVDAGLDVLVAGTTSVVSQPITVGGRSAELRRRFERRNRRAHRLHERRHGRHLPSEHGPLHTQKREHRGDAFRHRHTDGIPRSAHRRRLERRRHRHDRRLQQRTRPVPAPQLERHGPGRHLGHLRCG
ncbi:MAG: SBBP repeat-containing protein [Blastocatellia bacterium]|nr:SBBP repeat-containing protein [Blastocatellia bacterium]